MENPTKMDEIHGQSYGSVVLVHGKSLTKIIDENWVSRFLETRENQMIVFVSMNCHRDISWGYKWFDIVGRYKGYNGDTYNGDTMCVRVCVLLQGLGPAIRSLRLAIGF